MSNTKVLVGFSGGVDSTAAVILLNKAGYEVVGLCFNVLGNDFDPKIDETAKKLKIKLIKKSVESLFREKVIDPFISEYESGRTPNPCIICNPDVKFKTLLEAAYEEGCQYIATGHYAGVKEINGRYYIQKAVNIKKDQSYMLYRLPQNVLSRLILPLHGVIDKDDIRNLVREYEMPNSEDKDSQDICFIPDGDYFAYLLAHGAKNTLGNYIDKDGRVLGQHKGILSYTLGQRKGLGIALGKPAYVTEFKGNDIVIGDENDLYKNIVTVNQLVWSGKIPQTGEKLYCKLRYSAREAYCTITYIDEDKMVLNFEEAQRAPTPGQSAVLYHNNLALGGGFIVK